MSDEAPPSGAAALNTGTAHDSQPVESSQVSTPPPGTPASTPAGGGDSPWYSTIEDADLRGIAESRKFDSPEKVLKSYSDLEKLRGVPAERLAKIPESLDNTEAMGEIYNKLGRPEKADGYKVEGREQNDQNKWFFDLMHETGASNASATKINNAIVTQLEAHEQHQIDQFAQQAELDVRDLRSEWGAAYDSNMSAGKAIVAKLGLTPEQMQGMERSMGTKDFMNMFAKMGGMIGEAKVMDNNNDGSGFNNNMTPEGASAARDQLNADPAFRERLFSQDKMVRQAAMAERNRFSRLAYDQ